MSFIRTIALAGAFATTVTFAANAAPIISASIVPDAPGGTAANMPFALESFGSGGGPGFVTNAPQPITGGMVTFSGLSGVYAGDSSGVTRSPLRDGSGNPTNLRYLNARAGNASNPGGSVVLTYTAARTTFNLLWGSVDVSPATYNQLTFAFSGGGGTEVVSGASFAALASVVSGTSNLAVTISNLASFDTVTITASQEAFEFVPGVPVPEPASLALLGMGLLGLGAAARRRRA